MTIAEFKAKHWQDELYYADTVTEKEIIHGWVTSSDGSGNIYKMLYITDESGASLPILINHNGLDELYPIGQEIVLSMKGAWVGKYNGMMQVGHPSYYAAGGVWEVTYMSLAEWLNISTKVGDPDASRVVPVDISLDEIEGKSDAATLLKYQGLLVRVSDVTIKEADGKTTYCEPNATTNRTLVDAEGHSLVLRTSNYADFADELLPRDTLEVVGQLAFVATRSNPAGTWQLFLRDLEDVTVTGVAPVPEPEPVLPVTQLNEGFDNALPDNWTPVVVQGDKNWYQTVFQGNGYAAVTGYRGTQPPFDIWLMTPALDIKNATSKILSFRTEVARYGSNTSTFEVYLLNDVNPSAATVKVNLNPLLATPTNGSPVYSDWVNSGNIDLSQWADGNYYYIGFRYYATMDANYATWCLDDVKFE